MKWNILLVVGLLISITSCKSRDAVDLRDTILQKERVAFNLVLGKNGLGAQKLACIIKGDYKGALALVDQQASEFDKLIKDIEVLPADEIREGKLLKHAAAGYYAALKTLHYFDRKEIEQVESVHQLKGSALETAQQKNIELARSKKALYEKVYQQESILSEAFKKFNSANGL